MSKKAHKSKKTEAHTPSHANQAASGQQGRPMPILPTVLAVGAILVIAAVALLLSNGGSPASPAAASAGAASNPAPAASPTAALVAVKRATAAATQPAAAPTAGTSGASQGKVAVTAQNGVVTLALADVSDGKAHFYTYEGAGKVIPFFVLKSSDGVIRAAFDACDVCFPFKKGYHQEGDEMVCNNCGSRFPSVKINEVKGGCNPAPLDRQAGNGVLTFQVTDLEAGAKYF